MGILAICLACGTKFWYRYLQTSYPEAYGLHRKTQDDWTAAYFYPFVSSKDERSEWYRDFKHEDTATKEALNAELTKGKEYLWCACGRSQNAAFCDGSHHGKQKLNPKSLLLNALARCACAIARPPKKALFVTTPI